MAKIDPTDNQYDLAELRLDKESIVCEDFQTEIETDSDVKYATNQKDPIKYTPGKNKYSWEANGIHPKHKALLEEYQDKGILFPITSYYIDGDENYKEGSTFLNSKITNITEKHDDDGMTLDVSGSSLSKKRK